MLINTCNWYSSNPITYHNIMKATILPTSPKSQTTRPSTVPHGRESDKKVQPDKRRNDPEDGRDDETSVENLIDDKLK